MAGKNGLALHADDLREMGHDVVAALSKLDPKKADELKYNWKFWARPSQLPPKTTEQGEPWNNWLILAGRGFGKSRAGVEWVREQVKLGKRRVMAVAATNSDIERVMIKGESGFLASCWKGDKTYAGVEMGYPEWSPTKRTLTWANGASVTFFSAEEPDRLRGPQGDAAWVDEICAWSRDRDTWQMLSFCLRLGKHPQVCITTTPKPTKLIRDIIKNPKTVVTSGSTFDNSANLADTYLSAVKAEYEGTRIGRQELYAEIMDEASGALWTRDILAQAEFETELDPVEFAKTLARVVVSVDPQITTNAESDMTGIVVAGMDVNGICYVLQDATDRFTPEGWATKAIELYHLYQADRLVAERNQGGEMVRHTFKTVDETLPVKLVHASRGKFARAEPVSSLYERGRVKHLKGLDALEDQMVQWEPLGSIGSPDRLDACLIGSTQVLTDKGYKPIPEVSVGELVLTSEGYKPVLWSGKTRESTSTLDIGLSNDYMITATPEHPFMVVGKGWVAAADLTAGDQLVTDEDVWNTQSKLSFSGNATNDTPTTKTSQNKGTTHSALETAIAHFTETFGNTSMVKSLKDTISTTKTETTSTTTLKTLSASPHLLTPLNTKKSSGNSELSRWTTQGLSPTSGMEQRKDESFTLNKADSLGLEENPTSSQLVSSVKPSFWPSLRQSGAQALAKTKHTKKSIENLPNAQSAEQSSKEGSMAKVPTPAPVSVVQVTESKLPSDVYNLHVKDCHEFVANGVLVHNCVWAITELALKGIARPDLNLSYSDNKGTKSS